jgi:hypothetical protein
MIQPTLTAMDTFPKEQPSQPGESLTPTTSIHPMGATLNGLAFYDGVRDLQEHHHQGTCRKLAEQREMWASQ